MDRGWSVQALARRGTTQPVEPPVPADDARFRASKGDLRVALRLLRRQLETSLSGQRHHEGSRIDPAWRRALWIHAEAPQIGDALMDLAPRSLLVERGIAVDLLAPAATAAVFAGDRHFGRVLVDPARPSPGDHDFAIVDSRCWKALAAKRRACPALPWVSLKGDYLTYDYHRALLATRRIAALLGIALDAEAEARHARQKLLLDEPPAPLADGAAATVAFALGGVRAERTYGGWPEVAAGLQARGIDRFVLLGSDNGRAMADAIRQRLPEASCTDLVARCDLQATRQAMVGANLVLAADGGLMHLALTTPTPLVALFDAAIDPAWRMPPGFDGRVLRASAGTVKAIDPGQVAAAALALLAAPAPPLSARR